MPKQPDTHKSARFIKTARELGVDTDADPLDRVFGKVVLPVVPKPTDKGRDA